MDGVVQWTEALKEVTGSGWVRTAQHRYAVQCSSGRDTFI